MSEERAGKISFKGVEEAKERIMTPVGTIDVFTIEEVKFDATTKKGTYYMGVTFGRLTDSFNHSFFLSEKALPRVKSLCKVAGKELGPEDELAEEQLKALLTGKKMALKVIPKFDEENGKVYPDLPFGGFAKTVDKKDELAFSDQEKANIAKAKQMIAAS